MQDISQYCQKEISQFMSQDPHDLIKNYCSTVNVRVLVLLGIILAMYILEPYILKQIMNLKLNRKFESYFADNEQLCRIYRAVTAGMIFMSGYAIWIMSR